MKRIKDEGMEIIQLCFVLTSKSSFIISQFLNHQIIEILGLQMSNQFPNPKAFGN